MAKSIVKLIEEAIGHRTFMQKMMTVTGAFMTGLLGAPRLAHACNGCCGLCVGPFTCTFDASKCDCVWCWTCNDGAVRLCGVLGALLTVALLARVPIAASASSPSAGAQETTRITGVVLDEQARGVAAARVGLLLTDPVRVFLREHPAAVLSTRASHAGRFELIVPARLRAVTLVARSPGLSPCRAGPIALDTATREIAPMRLSAGSQLNGRVLDEHRNAIRKASVVVVPDSPKPDTIDVDGRTKSTTDREGAFTLPGVEPGAYTLSARAEGFAPRTLRELKIGEQSERDRNVVVQMFQATYLRGRTVDSAGRPIAQVALTATPGLDETVKTTSDDAGRFQLGPFARGTRVYLHATAGGYTPARTDDVIAPNDALIVQLSRNGVFRGQVLDADSDRPLPRFEIVFHHRGPLRSAENPGRRVFQSQDGRFEWLNIQSGTWGMTVQAEGYVAREVKGLFIPPDDAGADIVLTLQKGRTLRGRVFDRATGLAVTAATVGFMSERRLAPETLDMPVPSATTAADGTFELSALPAERMILSVYAPQYVPKSQIVDASSDTFVDIGLSSGASISGQLVSARESAPVAGVVTLVSVAGDPGAIHKTDSAGHFVFGQLKPGLYAISAETKRGQASVRYLTLTDQKQVSGLVLRMDSGSTISGKVSGLLPGELGRVRIAAAGPKNFRAQAAADEQGVYALQGIPLGRIEMTATTALERTMVKTLELTEVGSESVHFEFPPGYRVSGRVTRGGKGVRFHKLAAAPLDGQAVASDAETTQYGQYSFEGLPAGNYLISSEGGRAVRLYVGGDSTLDMELPNLSVAGSVADSKTGEVLSNALIEARSSDPRSGSARVFTNSSYAGEFSLQGLDPGDYVISAYKAGYDLAERQLSVTVSLSGQAFLLQPTAGVPVQVRDAATRVPIAEIWVIEMIGARNGVRLEMPLDENGVGLLPPSLRGRNFLISSLGYAPAQIAAWNGSPLSIALTLQTY